MYISKLKLRNFKNFECIDLDFGKMNIIVGANASGKSNLIKSFKFIKNVRNFGIDNAISLSGGIEYFQNIQLTRRKPTSIVITLKPEGGNFVKKLNDDTFILLSHEEISYLLEFKVDKSLNYSVVKEEIQYKTKLIHFDPNKVEENDVPVPVNEYSKQLKDYDFKLAFYDGLVRFENPVTKDFEFVYKKGRKKITELIDKDRISPIPVNFQSIVEDENSHQKRFDSLDSNGKSFKENKQLETLLEKYPLIPANYLNYAIYDFDLKKAKEGTPISGKAELEEDGSNLPIVIKNILDDSEKARQFSNFLSDVLPFIKNVKTEKFYDKSLMFKIREKFYGRKDIPSSMLSDGTISVTAILVALFFEDKELAIFEEPEHGVHPSLIAKLMQYFYEASENKQIIITTHSPEVLKHTKIEDLLLVSRNEAGCASIIKPFEKEMVQTFLKNDLGIEQLYTQNLLDL